MSDKLTWTPKEKQACVTFRFYLFINLFSLCAQTANSIILNFSYIFFFFIPHPNSQLSLLYKNNYLNTNILKVLNLNFVNHTIKRMDKSYFPFDLDI